MKVIGVSVYGDMSMVDLDAEDTVYIAQSGDIKIVPLTKPTISNRYVVLADTTLQGLEPPNNLMSKLCDFQVYGEALIAAVETNESGVSEVVGLSDIEMEYIIQEMQTENGTRWCGEHPGEMTGMRPFYFVYRGGKESPWSQQTGYTMVMAEDAAAAYTIWKHYHPNDIADVCDKQQFNKIRWHAGRCLDFVSVRRTIPEYPNN